MKRAALVGLLMMALPAAALPDVEIGQLATPVPPRFTGIEVVESDVSLSVGNLPIGMPTALQRASTLQPSDWRNVAAFIATSQSTNISQTVDGMSHFYRMVCGSAVFHNGLALYLPFNGDTSDFSTNETDGINTGATLTADRNGSPTNAYFFDATGTEIYLPDTPSLDVTNLTLSFWFNLSSYDGARELVNKLGSSGNISYGTELDAGGALYFRVSTDGTTQTLTDLAATSVVATATWYHFAGTYDGSEMRLYMNGQLESTHPKTGPVFNSSADLRIGRYGYYAGWVFHGAIDEVALWDRALTESEISLLYLDPIRKGSVSEMQFAGKQKSVLIRWS